MSQSNLEQLLSELDLREPSPELDDRIFNCLAAVPATVRAENAVQGRQRSATVSGATAAALLIGCLVGFLIGNSVGAAPEDDTMASTVLRPNDELLNPTGEQSARPTNASEWQGPAVGMTCALTSLTTSPELGSSECNDCHSGLSESLKSFRERHLTMSQFATCTLCHTADLSLNSAAVKSIF